MTGKFDIVGGQMLVEYNGRTVIQTSGTLLQFITGNTTYTDSLVWPDANKAEIYQYNYEIVANPVPEYAASRLARSIVGARPQEWSDTIVLGAAPTGSDIFIGRAILERTVNPSHTWITQTISPMIPQNVPIQINGGSMIVEAAAAITRSLTIDVTGGNLVARLEQSVGPPAGNFRSQGTMPPSDPSPVPGSRSGNSNTAGGGVDSIPVYWNDVLPYYRNENQIFDSGVFPGANARNWCIAAQNGGADEVTYSDPTDYGSTYSLSLSGRFGRRS